MNYVYMYMYIHAYTSTDQHKLLQTLVYLSEVFSEDLDQVGHGKVQDVVPPGQLQDHIRTEEVVAREEAGSEAVGPPDLKEPTNQTLRNLNVS